MKSQTQSNRNQCTKCATEINVQESATHKHAPPKERCIQRRRRPSSNCHPHRSSLRCSRARCGLCVCVFQGKQAMQRRPNAHAHVCSACRYEVDKHTQSKRAHSRKGGWPSTLMLSSGTMCLPPSSFRKVVLPAPVVLCVVVR